MTLFCYRHRTLTLFRACPDCLRARAVRSLNVRRAEVEDLRARAAALRAERTAPGNGGGA